MAISLAALTYIKWLFDQEETKQDNIAAFRDYYDGDQKVLLSERQQEYLEQHGGDVRFCLNICRLVVDALADRLRVSGFRVTAPPTQQDGEDAGGAPEEPASAPDLAGAPLMERLRARLGMSDEETEEPEKTQEQEWGERLQEYWQDNDGDARERRVHKAACRDGDSYVIVDGDNVKRRPRWIDNPAFSCVGDNPNNGIGVKVHYDGEGQVLCASRRWKEDVLNDETGEVVPMRYMTLYYPDRVEKYETDSKDSEAAWQERTVVDADGIAEPWPLSWVDKKTGQPLGVPIFHFKNSDAGYVYGQSELAAILPIQDGINKTLVDMLAHADYSAFRILTQVGGEEPEGGIFPGAIWYQSDADTRFSSIEGAGSDTFIATIEALIRHAATVSRTPQYMFQVMGGAPSGEALKTAEAGLVDKARDRQVGFGDTWAQVMQMCVKVARAFYDDPGIPEGALITALWDSPETRSQVELTAKAEFLRAGGYEEGALRAYGCDDAEIAQLMREKKRSRHDDTDMAALVAQQARARFEQQGGMPGQAQPGAMPRPGQFGQQGGPAQPQPANPLTGQQ